MAENNERLKYLIAHYLTLSDKEKQEFNKFVTNNNSAVQESDIYLSVNQAGQLLNISAQTVKRLITDNKLTQIDDKVSYTSVKKLVEKPRTEYIHFSALKLPPLTAKTPLNIADAKKVLRSIAKESGYHIAELTHSFDVWDKVKTDEEKTEFINTKLDVVFKPFDNKFLDEFFSKTVGRRKTILKMVLTGYSKEEIAEYFQIKIMTVSNHLKNAFYLLWHDYADYLESNNLLINS